MWTGSDVPLVIRCQVTLPEEQSVPRRSGAMTVAARLSLSEGRDKDLTSDMKPRTADLDFKSERFFFVSLASFWNYWNLNLHDDLTPPTRLLQVETFLGHL